MLLQTTEHNDAVHVSFVMGKKSLKCMYTVHVAFYSALKIYLCEMIVSAYVPMFEELKSVSK